ncbi:hypothetical protein R6Q57_002198 [Mikania cordata]
MDILKLSFDGLEAYQKELFLDIACFWRFQSPDNAMEIFEACGYHPEIGIKVLRQKALITIVYKEFVGNVFDMHDLVEEMGHYIVKGEHPMNPIKHSRVWKREEINQLCFGDATMENDKTEALKCLVTYSDENDLSSRLCKIVSNMKKLRWVKVTMYKDVQSYREPTFLSNELQYINWTGYLASPFPDIFPLIKLVVLKLRYSKQKVLRKGCKHLPQLKVLHLQEMKKLQSTPDFHGLPRLQKLTLQMCYKLEEIHSSFGSHTSLEYLKLLSKSSNYLIAVSLLNCRISHQVILNASYCESLITIGNFHRNCKWLSHVSLVKTNNLNDCQGLLQSMLEVLSGMSSESDGDENTLVWYLSFGSLRDAAWWDQTYKVAWWDQTYKALSFELAEFKCSGFGVRLVAKTNRNGLTETSTTNSYDYTPDIKIELDKGSDAIMISSSVFNYYIC